MAWSILSTINLTGQRVDAPAWATATFYQFGTLVFINSKHYSCIAAHTSGVFATDLASLYWTEINITDSIAFNAYLNPNTIDGIRVVRNGVEQARDVNHIYLDVKNDYANARTTGYVGFRQALALGDQVVILHDDGYFNYVSTGIPDLIARTTTLENKIGGTTSVPSSLNALDVRVIALEAADPALQLQITNNKAVVDGLIPRIAMLEFKMTAAEASILALRKFAGVEGVVSILNNQAVPVEIPEFLIDGTVHSSVRLDYEIQRFTGTEYRSSTGTLHFCLKENGVWMTDRNVVSFDVDGITFTINTELPKKGRVYYTTDEVIGASYVGTLKFRRYVFEV